MRADRGFTLMEVLVALVLMTLFAVVSYRALDAVLQGQRRATAEMDRWRELAAAFAWMEADLSNAVIRPDPHNPLQNGFHAVAEADGDVQFELVRRLPEDADTGLQRIGYRCAGAALERLVWPDVNDPAAAPRPFALLDSLRSCAIRYLGEGGQWLAVWQQRTGNSLPRAVELSIGDADGAVIRRVWRVQ
jgi:general secretion pathway protein J